VSCSWIQEKALSEGPPLRLSVTDKDLASHLSGGPWR
jgi:hypothetical protein